MTHLQSQLDKAESDICVWLLILDVIFCLVESSQQDLSCGSHLSRESSSFEY